MSFSRGRLAQLFLRYSVPLAELRRLPVLGPWLSWASRRIKPRDALAWVQIRRWQDA